MKRFLFIASVLFLSLCAFAQEVTTLTFTAKQQNQAYQKLDSVVVTNLSQNWSEVLLYPDTLLLMNTVGITDWENPKGNVKLYQNIPNPFHGITNFNLTLTKKEKVDLVIFDINGKKVAEYHNTLGSGEHTFRAMMNTPQTYLLSSVSKNGNTSIKMINLSNTGEQARIEYVSSKPLPMDMTRKQSTNPFAKGDNMRYVGYATQNDGSHDNTIEQTQQGSETIIFTFPNEQIPAYLKVFTDEVSNLTATMAMLNGHWEAHDMTVEEEGFYYKAKTDTAWQTFVCEHQESEFSFSIRNLTPSTEYVVKAYAIANSTTVWGEEVAFTTTEIVKPKVQIDSVGKIDCNTATAYASFVKGDEALKKVGIELNQGGNWTLVASFIGTKIVSPFEADMFALTHETKYAVRAFAITASDTVYSEEKYFTTTRIQEPTVKTLEADGISHSRATLHGSYVKASENITATGFAYKSEKDVDWIEVKADKTEEFSAVVAGLTPTTPYTFKAFVQTETYKIYGEELAFSTIEYFGPTVTTSDIADVTMNTATISGKIENGQSVIEYGILYNIYPDMTFDYQTLEKNAYNPFFLKNVVVGEQAPQQPDFKINIGNLVAGTIYYARAYAKTDDGYIYGADIKFETKNPSGLIDCGTIKDVEGNEYRTAKYGSSCWTRDNVRSTVLRDGTPITSVEAGTSLGTSMDGSGEQMLFNIANAKIVNEAGEVLDMSSVAKVAGHYYNKSVAVNNKICPEGWSVPTEDDWCDLFDYLNMEYSLAKPNCTGGNGKVQENSALLLASPIGWKNAPLANAENELGFNYFYVGDYNDNGKISYLRTNDIYTGLYVSNMLDKNSGPRMYQFIANYNYVQKWSNSSNSGFHLRCVKVTPEVPTVKTLGVIDLTDSSAVLNGQVIGDGHLDITKTGFYLYQSATDTLNGEEIAAGTTFTAQAKLEADHEYAYRAFADNALGTGMGEIVTFRTYAKPTVPAVKTLPASDILLTAATLKGSVSNIGGYNQKLTECGFVYHAKDNVEEFTVVSPKTDTIFAVVASDLKQGATYIYKAYAKNQVGIAYGEEVEFTTLIEASVPNVQTVSVENIRDISAVVKGLVSSDGGDVVTERGFCYSSTNKEPNVTDDIWTDVTVDLGEFSTSLTDLSFETTYYIRAYAKNSVGVGYGDVIEFKTLEEIKELQVIAGEATGITRTSATVSAEVKYGKDVELRGFLYSLYPGRVLESQATYELISVVKDTEAGEGKFSFELSNLIQGATYYVRAFATTPEKTVYSEDIKVVMQDPDGLVDCGKMIDADGNEYRTVVLGNTCWIRENLHTTKYADGTPITEYIPQYSGGKVASALPTDQAQYSRFAVLNTTDTMPMEVSGLYYGLGFINDTKAICPKGWHVSSMDDWTDMLNYVSKTYADNTPVTMNTAGTGAIGATALSNPLVIPHYFVNYAFGKKAENSNATGFGWFYAGSMNGNTTQSYQRCEGRYDAYWTSTKTGSNCLPWFIQNSGSNLQRYVQGACQLYGYLIRCVKDPEASEGIVETKGATNVTYQSATLNGNISFDGYSEVTERGFYWGKTTELTEKQAVEASSNTFSYDLVGLEPETEYFFKAYMINEIGESTGGVYSVTTLKKPVLPTVTTKEATNIALTTATVGGEVLTDGGCKVTERGICYATTENPDMSATVISSGFDIGTFTVDLKGLTADTKYFVRAYAINEMGVAYGENVPFNTLAKADVPKVQTSEVKSIKDVRATVVGNVASDGGDMITERGFCYSNVNAEPTVADNKVVASAAGLGDFSMIIDGLTKDTKYYVRAYAKNSAGEGYGDVMEFTTLAELKDPMVTTLEATELTRTFAVFNGEVLNMNGMESRGFTYSLYPGMTLESNATYELIGTVQEDSDEEGKFSFKMEKLVQGAVYYVRAFVIAEGVAYYGEDVKVTMPDPEGLVDCGLVTDMEGHTYRTVKLAGQCWMRENLKTTKLSDGTDINLFTVSPDPANETGVRILPKDGAYYSPVVYNGDTLPVDVVGNFYNYGTALSEVSPCPKGWHVATLDEWKKMLTYIQDTYKLSSSSNLIPIALPYYWNGRGGKDCTNASGFNYFYAGDINYTTWYNGASVYRFEGRYDGILTSTANGKLPYFMQTSGGTEIKSLSNSTTYGQFIRCVQDAE